MAPSPHGLTASFRQSGLYRKKWDTTHFSDGRTYGEATIEKALADAQKFYTSGARRNGAAQTQQEGSTQFRLTDLGNGERLIARHGLDLRYCTPWGKGLVWDDKRWQIDATQEVRQRARETVRAIYAETAGAVDETERKAIAQHAMRSEASARVDAMVSLAQMDCSVLPEALDTDLWALNVPNGTIDLHTGALRPQRREDLLIKLAPAFVPTCRQCGGALQRRHCDPRPLQRLRAEELQLFAACRGGWQRRAHGAADTNP